MSDLTGFLLARIAEDEDVARAGVYPAHGGDWYVIRPGVIGVERLGSIAESTMFCHADHIARHDPARVLAECEAKRRIVEELARPCPVCLDGKRCVDHDASAGESTWRFRYDRDAHLARLLALPYAAHPDYREEWRP